jgi:radical SAM protein with 4Fe4S-binding SPASM domain
MELKNRLLNRTETPKPQCVELHNHMRLMPNGDIMTCVYYPVVVGNLRKESLEEVWFGEKIQPQRRVVKNCPGCWAGCEAKPNAIYTGDFVKAFWLGGLKDSKAKEQSREAMAKA